MINSKVVQCTVDLKDGASTSSATSNKKTRFTLLQSGLLTKPKIYEENLRCFVSVNFHQCAVVEYFEGDG